MSNIEKTPLDEWTERKIGRSFSRGSLLGYQLEKIRELLLYLRKNSPYYREHLKDMPQSGPENLAGLAAWPLTGAEDLRRSGSRMVCVSQDEISRVVSLSTSGTAGGSKRLWFTESDQELTIDFFRAGMSTFTRSGDVVYIAMPGPRPGSIGRLLAASLGRIGASGMVAGPVGSVRDAAREIAAAGATHFVGLPKQAAALASYLARSGMKTRLRTFLLSGDYVPSSLRLRLQRMLGAAVYDHWGMTETGLGGGVFCGAMAGYHMREADLYIEIIDPGSLRAVPDGAYGEIVVTTLTRAGMPLFRYRTGDIGRRLEAPCRCGSKLPLLDRAAGRLDDFLVLPNGGRLYRRDFEELVYSFDDVCDYRLSLDPLSLEIVFIGRAAPACGEAVSGIFPGRITVTAADDLSFDGPQKSFWSLLRTIGA